MDDTAKGKATPKAPQNQKAPGAPRTVTVAFVGGFEIGVVQEATLGALHEGQFDVPGGSIILRWPLKFTPKIIEGMQSSYDDAIAAGALEKTSGIALPKRDIWTP